MIMDKVFLFFLLLFQCDWTNTADVPQHYIDYEKRGETGLDSNNEVRDIDIDLNNPGVKFSKEFSEIIRRLLPSIKQKLNYAHVILSVNVKPRRKMSKHFQKKILKKLLRILKKYFNSSSINVKSSSIKGSYAKFLNIEVEIYSGSVNTNDPTYIIDLSKPGINIHQEINNILNNIIYEIKKKLEVQSIPIAYFKIIPPRISTKDLHGIIKEAFETFFRNSFTSSTINVEVNSQVKIDGSIENILVTIKIQKNSPNINTPPQDPCFIDVSDQGNNLQHKINDMFICISQQVIEQLNNGFCTTWNVVVIPPTGSTDDFHKKVSNALIIARLLILPSSDISWTITSEKDQYGYVKKIIVTLVIKPKSPFMPDKWPYTQVNISEPGDRIHDEINEMVKRISHNIIKKLNEGSSADEFVVVIPPRRCTEDFHKRIADILVLVLRLHLPPSDFTFTISSLKDEDGYLIKLIVQIVIKPRHENPSDEPGNIVIDKPEDLRDKIDHVISGIANYIIKRLKDGSSTDVFITVIPPKGCTDAFHKILSDTFVLVLRLYLPPSDINLTVISEKDEYGYLIKIIVKITIKLKYPSLPGNSYHFDYKIEPGYNIRDGINDVFKGVINQIIKQLNDGSTVKVLFVVTPSRGSTDDLPKKIADILVSILRSLLPPSDINITNESEKDEYGYLIKITVKITIKLKYPSLPNESDENRIDISKPGANIEEEIKKLLAIIIFDIKKKLEVDSKAKVCLKVIPPQKSSQELINIILEKVTEIFQRLFISCTINVKANAQMNSQGYLLYIFITINIQYNSDHMTTLQSPIIDVSRPGANLQDEINEMVRTILHSVIERLNVGLPLTVNVEVIPPKASTEVFHQILEDALLLALRMKLPPSVINMTVTSDKGNFGYLKKVFAQISIEPKSP